MKPHRYSIRAMAELAAYQVLAGAVSVFGASTVPLLYKKFRRISEGFSHYLGRVPVPEKQPTIWVHGVSMGESLVAIAFASELKKSFPKFPLVFTSTHPDVLRAVKQKAIADVVAYFPLDTMLSMKRAFNRWKPAAIFVAETDFWPVFSYYCNRKNVPLMLINGRISDKIADFYAKASGLAEVVFGAFDWFLVQTPADKARLLKVGVEEKYIEVVGNMKADLVVRPQAESLAEVAAWQGSRKLVVFGSLHQSEFEQMSRTFAALVKNNIAIIIAPRNLKFCDEWKAQLQEQGHEVCFKTEQRESQIMILNTMGELSGLYALADAAFVGGSIDLHVGGHNPLEVIQQGVPILIGPNYQNFADIIQELKSQQAVKICETADELGEMLLDLLNNKEYADNMTLRATEVLNKNRGALRKTLLKAEHALRQISSGVTA
ncbi:MAG: lipid IV(A) 3-deoxy-D-manno-octulosonic acid transferase [Candidatus Rifleibacteriota bacterium]